MAYTETGEKQMGEDNMLTGENSKGNMWEAEKTGEENLEQRQREQLRAFDKELYSYTGEMAWIFKGIGFFMALICTILPVAELRGEGGFGLLEMMIMSALWIPYGVLAPYTSTREPMTAANKDSRTWAKMRYLPLGKKIYVQVRLGYLFRYLWKLALGGLFIQGLATLAAGQSFGILTVLYPVGVLLLLPMLSGLVLLVTER